MKSTFKPPSALLLGLNTIPGWKGALSVCLLALLLRTAVASNSWGSNDIETWRQFAISVREVGVLETYRVNPMFNHPPLMGYLAACAHWLSNGSPLSFAFVFKIPSLLANTAAILLVQRAARLNYACLWLLALSPSDILISAHHGNTDSLCVLACIASVAAANAGRTFWAGALLGAALNVKLVPVPLILPLALSVDRRRLPHFVAGLSLGIVPFVPALILARDAFVRNALSYNSILANWGIGLILEVTKSPLPRVSAAVLSTIGACKTVILALSAALGVVNRMHRGLNRWELCAAIYCMFLFFAPGFGPQYLLYPTVFLVAADPKRGAHYVSIAGAFAFLLYYAMWLGTFPAYSLFRAMPPYAYLVGFWLWLALGRYILGAFVRVVKQGTLYSSRF